MAEKSEQKIEELLKRVDLVVPSKSKHRFQSGGLFHVETSKNPDEVLVKSLLKQQKSAFNLAKMASFQIFVERHEKSAFSFTLREVFEQFSEDMAKDEKIVAFSIKPDNQSLQSKDEKVRSTVTVYSQKQR